MRPVVRRDRAWIEREYGRQKWPAVQRLVDEAVSERRLDRALAVVARRERALADPVEARPLLMSGVLVDAPAAGAQAAYQALIVETVIAQCRDETDAVVELGSGWARNLLHVWAGGGPRAAAYTAAELTAAGRHAGAALASLDPALRFRSVAYDYRQPCLAASLRRASHAVVFTVHSIEQVPWLPAAFVDDVAALADEVTCLHLEPIGWQMAVETDHVGASQAYAREHDYNRNLVAVLHDAERDGKIQIRRMLPDVLGTNPENPTSLMVWRTA